MNYNRFKKITALLLALVLLPVFTIFAFGEEEAAVEAEQPAASSSYSEQSPAAPVVSEPAVQEPAAEDIAPAAAQEDEAPQQEDAAVDVSDGPAEPEDQQSDTAEPDETGADDRSEDVGSGENTDAAENSDPGESDELDGGEESGEDEIQDEGASSGEVEEQGPERVLSEDELWEYEEATFNFTFQIDTLWDWYGDTMIIAVRNAGTMIAAVNTINSLGEGDYIIALAADVVMPEAFDTVLRFTCGNTTILGCGHTLSLTTADGGDPGIVVEGEDTVLSLGSYVYSDTLTITGCIPTEDEDYSSLFAVEGGTLIMNDGVTIRSHQAGHGAGGAVLVSGGCLCIFGGTVEDCGIVGYDDVYGGGIGVEWGGTLLMYGGEITGCYAMSIEGTSYGGGIAAIPSDSAAAYGYAPVELLGGTVTDCLANYGGGAAFLSFPGAAVIGGAAIQYNIACGADEDSGAGVWYDDADGFALYLFDRCRVSGNVFYADGFYTTGFESADPVRGDALFALKAGSSDGAQASELWGDESILYVGDLKPGSYVSLGGGENSLSFAVEVIRPGSFGINELF